MFSQGNNPPQFRPPPFPQSQPNPPQLPPFPFPPPPLSYQPQYNNMPPQHPNPSFFHQPTQTYLPLPFMPPYSQGMTLHPSIRVPTLPPPPPPPPLHSHGPALYFTPPPPPPEIQHVQAPCPPTLPPPPPPPLPPSSPSLAPPPPPTETSSEGMCLNDVTDGNHDVQVCINEKEVDESMNKDQAIANDSGNCKVETGLSIEEQEKMGSVSQVLEVVSTSHIDNIIDKSPSVSPMVSDMDMEDDVSAPNANSGDVPSKISAKEVNTSSSSGNFGMVKTSPVPDRTDEPSESKAACTEGSPVSASPDVASNALADNIHECTKDVSPFCLIQGYVSEDVEEKSESLNHTCPSNIGVVQKDEKMNDKALNCEPPKKYGEKINANPGPADEKHSKEVDEFGRLQRKDIVDSDSDEAHFNRRRTNRKNKSRSRSPHGSRSRRRSPSPRRREKRGRSRSWSPDRRRQKSYISRREDKAQTCMNFMRGKCYRGASCKFSHQGATQHINKRHYQDIPLDSKLEKHTSQATWECNDIPKMDATKREKQCMGDKNRVEIIPIASQKAINILQDSHAYEAANVSIYNPVAGPQNSIPLSTSYVPPNFNDVNYHTYQKALDQVGKPHVYNVADAIKSGLVNELIISVPSQMNFNNVNLEQTPPVPLPRPYVTSDNLSVPFPTNYQFQPTPSSSYNYYPPVTTVFHSQSMAPHSIPHLTPLLNSHTVFSPKYDTNSITRSHFIHSEQLQRPLLPVLESKKEQLPMSISELTKQPSNSEDVSQSHFDQFLYTFDHRPTSTDNNSNCISKNGTPNANITKEPTLPTSDAYDPLLDSINPISENHESCEADEFGEEAVDAEVGVVENDSSQLIDENNKRNVEESENETKRSKDSRSMKLFKSALADFVKEILKPSWRQGNISKEAFKTIVKKTVDKVSEAMPSNRIPKSQAKINQYVESSQQKLTKLVTGYIDKYVKM